MSVKRLSAVVVTIALGTCPFTSQAENNAGHNWMPRQPSNQYWQAPNWSERNTSTQRPAYTSPPPSYRLRNNANSNPALYQDGSTPPPPTGPYSGSPAPRVNTPVPAPGPYRGAPPPRPRGAYNEPSAFYTPGYNPYRNNRRNNKPWDSNKFWGRSGPSKWMSPNKRDWEDGWDDMINAPSRMGEMPGGWSAPEVSVPNPIDMGDQVQDNMKDLPDQMRDGNIGNDVSN